MKRRGFWFLLAILVICMAGVCEAAVYDYAYPTAETKKGLYVADGMEEDALDLGVNHATINIVISHMLAEEWQKTDEYSYSYEYGGQTYWFRKSVIDGYDTKLTRLSQGGCIVTGILLVENRADYAGDLVYPAAKGKTANYYLWNMTDANAVAMIQAAVSFLQTRYGAPTGPRIVGWIVGNEVNNARDWNWGGAISFDTYMDIYAQEVVTVAAAARSIYSNARVYISLDHYWNASMDTYWYAGKKVLTTFAAMMAARGYGNGTWCIACHPYNADLLDPDILTKSSNVKKKASTAIITMRNLKVLTKFVKKHYSEGCRIILSEQGYSSSRSAKTQARSVALAYYIAEAYDMVDAFIYHRQVDHSAEAASGAAFGLYTSYGGENAAGAKKAWRAYRCADSTQKNKFTKYAAKKAKKITGSKAKQTYKAATGTLKITKGLKVTENYTAGGGGWGALTSAVFENGVYTLVHDTTRNANVPWGIIRDGTINAKKLTKFVLALTVTGSTSGRCDVYVRLYSGAKKYYETHRVIGCGSQVNLMTDLKNWKARKNITRVKIMIRPKGGLWAEGASAVISAMGLRK